MDPFYQERELLALERTRAESRSQSRADADETTKQLQREMQAARLEGLRSVKAMQKRAEQEAKDLLVRERERAEKASFTRAERAAVRYDIQFFKKFVAVCIPSRIVNVFTVANMLSMSNRALTCIWSRCLLFDIHATG